MVVTEDLLSLKQSMESGGLLHQLVHKDTRDHSQSANCHNNNKNNNTNNNNFTYTNTSHNNNRMFSSSQFG